MGNPAAMPLEAELDQAIRERDSLQDDLDRVLYTFAALDEIGEWSCQRLLNLDPWATFES
jgi:hypothetical protein